MDWRIYYGDGSTVTSDDCTPSVVPKRNVQCIVRPDPDVGRLVERENDYYVWCDQRDNWKGVDQFGLFDYLIEPGVKIVLFGRTLIESEYKEVLMRAVNDPDMPPKSAWHKHERRAD